MVILHYSSLIDIIKSNKASLGEINTQYINLLSSLTKTEKINIDFFLQKVEEISSIGEIFICYIIDNKDKINILGTGTIFFEPKIIHGGKYVGHIEDVIVNERYRNQGIARSILSELKERAYKKDCYKVILDCSEENKEFYEKNDFLYKGVQMAKYFI
jgi:glucosamine-phosphate N-acetyltransferase